MTAIKKEEAINMNPIHTHRGGVAVVLATYNGENYICEQLNSIMNQTHSVDKIFIFDDDSKDNTLELCRTIAKTYNGLFEIHKNEKNIGYRRNFEKALLAAKDYDIIFFSDQDDWWFPNKVETILRAFEESKNLYCFFSNAYITDENLNLKGNKTLFDLYFDKKKKQRFSKNPKEVLFSRATVTGCTMAIRNTIIEKVVPFSEIWVHDEWIAAISSLFGEVKYTEEKLIKYRKNQGQSIGVDLNKKITVHNHGLNKIKYALSTDATKQKIGFLNEQLFFLNNMNTIFNLKQEPIPKYLSETIKFTNALIKNYHNNFGSRLLFFVKNNFNGKYKKLGFPFSQRVRNILLHI